VPYGPYLCSIKQVIKADLGSPLQSGGITLQCGKYSGSVTVTFLLTKNLIGCQQVYPVLHCLRYFQTEHQEIRPVHSYAYS
jgi:hypothetical protein